jgi:hypothetical protein
MNAPRFFGTAQAFRDWRALHGATGREFIVGFNMVPLAQPCMRWCASVDQVLRRTSPLGCTTISHP